MTIRLPRSAGPARRTTTRLLDAEFPKYRLLFPSEWSATADIPVSALLEAVKRVALVADRGTPVRLDFSDGSHGVLIAPVESFQPSMPQLERLQRLVQGIDAAVAVFSRDGMLAAASEAARGPRHRHRRPTGCRSPLASTERQRPPVRNISSCRRATFGSASAARRCSMT